MKSKLKKILAAFILMAVIDIAFSSPVLLDLGIDNFYVGLLFVLGLLLGPYGALGASMASIVIDLMEGFLPLEAFYSAIISFGISYLAYKLWYSNFRNHKITKPRLDNIYHLILFLSIIFICGFVCSMFYSNLIYFHWPSLHVDISYILNFVNGAFVYGVIGIWLSKKIDFAETPKKSKRPLNKRLYRILFCSLIIVTIISFISAMMNADRSILLGETVLGLILLFAYLTKPFVDEIEESDEHTIIQKIIRIFIAMTLIIALMGLVVSYMSYGFIESIHNINFYVLNMPLLVIPDLILILFFIPGIIILQYIEYKVIKPISAFSEIEKFIEENEKIESEGLLNIYSDYINENDEIGTLARSYTDLINHNNNYIENIREIEGEKEHIKAELDIATKIQSAFLPTEAIVNDDFTVEGYSLPAKEVGGDFFDYYMLDDDNLAIVIGDASGKGVPAALLAMVTQVMIKQMFRHDQNPSKILRMLNNQFSENNPESMFITLWVGVYNRPTKKLTFSNAGHNPPLIKENGEFRYLDIDSGIVLGIMEGFEYGNEEMTLSDGIVLYTDGITDANNGNHEMYGVDNLLGFFNEFKSENDPIKSLLIDIQNFTEDEEQFDDMTLLYLMIT